MTWEAPACVEVRMDAEINSYQDDIDKERAYRDEQLEQLLTIENLAQSILSLKEEVAALSRETDDIKCDALTSLIGCAMLIRSQREN